MYAYKHTLVISVSLLIGLSIFINLSKTPAHAVEADDLKKTIEGKTKELEAINTELKKTQENLNTVSTKGKNLTQEVKKIDYQIQQLNLGIKSSEIKIDTYALEIQSLDTSISDKERKIALKQTAVTSFLRDLQERDREGTLFLLLKSKSLAESVFESQAISDLNRKLSDEVRSLTETKTALASNLSEVADKKISIEIEHKTLKNKRSISEDQKQDKKELLASTKNQQAIYAEQVKALEKKQEVIGEAIDAIETELRAKFDPSLLPIKRPGVLKSPLNGAPVTQEYGATAFAQKAYSTKFHNGIDYGAPLGTPVMAARDGKILAVGNNGKYQYGKYVVIEHDNGLTTLYAHLSKQASSVGESVKQGQVIGYIGSTGYAFGNHLHFTAYWSDSVLLKVLPTCNCGAVPVGVTINPKDYL